MKRISLLALLVAVVAAGCGGDDDGGGDGPYSAQLERACLALQKFNLNLPARQSDEDLSVAQVEKLAMERGEQFRTEVEALDPPANLEANHDRLIALLRQKAPDEPEQAVDYLAQYTAVYRKGGAPQCATEQAKSVAAFRESLENRPKSTP